MVSMYSLVYKNSGGGNGDSVFVCNNNFGRGLGGCTAEKRERKKESAHAYRVSLWWDAGGGEDVGCLDLNPQRKASLSFARNIGARHGLT